MVQSKVEVDKAHTSRCDLDGVDGACQVYCSRDLMLTDRIPLICEQLTQLLNVRLHCICSYTALE